MPAEQSLRGEQSASRNGRGYHTGTLVLEHGRWGRREGTDGGSNVPPGNQMTEKWERRMCDRTNNYRVCMNGNDEEPESYVGWKLGLLRAAQRATLRGGRPRLVPGREISIPSRLRSGVSHERWAGWSRER